MLPERLRILVAKVGLDGHDRGAKVVARVLMEYGFEVIYSGLHQSTEAIANAAVEEGVQCVGLSVLSGAHLAYTLDLRQRLDELGARDIAIMVGGIISREDVPELLQRGAVAVFPVGTNIFDIGPAIDALVRKAGKGREEREDD